MKICSEVAALKNVCNHLLQKVYFLRSVVLSVDFIVGSLLYLSALLTSETKKSKTVAFSSPGKSSFFHPGLDSDKLL